MPNFGKTKLLVELSMPAVDDCDERARMASNAILHLLEKQLCGMSSLYEGDHSYFELEGTKCVFEVVPAEGKQCAMSLLYHAANCLLEADKLLAGDTLLKEIAGQIRMIRREALRK